MRNEHCTKQAVCLRTALSPRYIQTSQRSEASLNGFFKWVLCSVKDGVSEFEVVTVLGTITNHSVRLSGSPHLTADGAALGNSITLPRRKREPRKERAVGQLSSNHDPFLVLGSRGGVLRTIHPDQTIVARLDD